MRVRVDFSQGEMVCRLCARVCAGVPKFSAAMVGVCCGYERAGGRGGGGDRFCACGSAVPEVRFELRRLSRLGAELLEFRAV